MIYYYFMDLFNRQLADAAVASVGNVHDTTISIHCHTTGITELCHVGTSFLESSRSWQTYDGGHSGFIVRLVGINTTDTAVHTVSDVHLAIGCETYLSWIVKLGIL